LPTDGDRLGLEHNVPPLDYITTIVYDNRNMSHPDRALEREILLSLWKIHILHHAAEGPIHGQWVTAELRLHGYHISPGTLYPLLNRLEGLGWLKRLKGETVGPKARKSYRLTKEGLLALERVREQVQELYREVGAPGKRGGNAR
jgi:PadR family transcriptional regulator, regulatory protein PadR